MKTYYKPKTYYSIKHMKTFDITCNLLKCRGTQNLEAEKCYYCLYISPIYDTRL